MYEILCIDDVPSSEYDVFYNYLSEDRKQEIDRLHFDKDKKLSVYGEMLAKKMISQKLDIEIKDIHFLKDQNGKPYAENIDIEFNISHSGDYVVCAISNTPIGIDIEQIRDIKDSLIRYVCQENELQYVYEISQETQKHFFEIWTSKEAYVKCIGTGMKDLKKVDVLNEDIQKHINTFYFQDYVISIYRQ